MNNTNQQVAAHILRRARDKISKPDTWIKGALSYDFYAEPNMTPRRAYCAVGAISRGLPEYSERYAAYVAMQYLIQALPDGFSQVAIYNDNPNTTQDDIVRLYDYAIKFAEEDAAA